MKVTRRDFVKAITVAAGLPACSSSSPGDAAPRDGARFFPQSVASGDPRPDSVVLWTRLADEQGPMAASLTLEVATDPEFQGVVSRTTGLTVGPEHDGTLKVKLTGLTARTSYHYRFVYTMGERAYTSPTGRTRTAPASGDDVPVRFAVTTCQDFVGRYYNSWQRLVDLGEDLDFVIFLGDYIYETTGDPRFMAGSVGERAVVFTDPGSALALGSSDAPYYAASSLSNYRDVHKAVRSDGFLRAAHERYAFVFMWDDHEYADDAHGSTSTYSDGRRPERDDERKRNAERDYFEYIPLDHPDAASGEVDVGAIPTYPLTRIYRDLGYGKNLRLVVPDLRTYRPDHLIPEEGFPGTVVVEQEEISALGATDAVIDPAFAYVNIDAEEHASAKRALLIATTQLAVTTGLSSQDAAAYASAAVRGNLALAYVNAVLTDPAVGAAPIPAEGAAHGVAWVHMGKRDLFSQQGSRYVVVKPALDLYAAALQVRALGAPGSPIDALQSALGSRQSAWLDTALASPEAWKVLVSSFSLTSMLIDLRNATDVSEPALRNLYYLNCDQWDGFPHARAGLLAKLASLPAPGALVVSGDIHASFASVESGVPCLTTPAISSASIQAGARGVALGAGFDEQSALYRYVVTDIATTLQAGNPAIAFTDPDSHGFMIVEVSAVHARATFHLLPSSEVQTSYAGKSAELADKFVSKSFAVERGTIGAT